MSCLTEEWHNQKCTLYGTDIPESKLVLWIKASQGTKNPSQDFSPPQPRGRPLNTALDDTSTTVSHVLHTALPEVLRMRKTARTAFLLCIYAMDQIVSKTKTHLALMLPRGSQWRARFSEVLQASDTYKHSPKGAGSPGSSANVRGLSKGSER